MEKNKVIIRYAQTPEEVEEQVRAGAHAFSSHYQGLLDAFKRHQSYPRHKREFSRIAVVDGRIASGLIIVDKTLIIGKARLRTAGIGDVFTHPDYRKKGYATAVLRDAVRFMKEEGFVLSCLFGIQDFYDRAAGFASALCNGTLTVATADAARCKGRASVVRLSARLLETIMSLRDEENRRLGFGFDRPREWWDYLVNRRGWKKATVFATGNKPFAYACLGEEDSLRVYEYACQPEGYEAFLGGLARHAQRKRLKEVRITTPPDHPFCDFALQYGGNLQLSYCRNGGGMMRIVNLDAMAVGMRAEWEERLRHSPLRGWTGELAFLTDLGKFGLTVRGGVITVRPGETVRGAATVRVPQRRLIQLLVGYRSVATVAHDPDVRIPAAALSVVEALFPHRHPMTLGSDGF